MCKSKNVKILLSVCCILLMSGISAAGCGNCPGDKKACCGKDGQCCKKKACPAGCTKACCAKGEKKACPAGCTKACCAKGEKKACCGTDGKCCKAAETVALGAPAPDFTATDINGNDVQLSKLKGKIVVLEWTNYDCPLVKPHYSEDSMTMSDLAKKYADKNVVWLTVNSTHYATVETNKEWAQKHKLPQTVLVDSEGKVGKLYQATNTPHMFIIDKDGKLVYEGAIDNAPLGKKPDSGYVNYVDAALAELTAGNPVSNPKTKPYGCSVKYAKK